jgi:hypothetical protein
LALYVADSIFIGDYLTTRGELPERDLQMLEDAGFTPALPPRMAEPPDYAPGITPKETPEDIGSLPHGRVPASPSATAKVP